MILERTLLHRPFFHCLLLVRFHGRYKACDIQRARHVQEAEASERAIDNALDALDAGLVKSSILVDETAHAVDTLVDLRVERNTELNKLLRQAAERSKAAAALDGLDENDLALLRPPGSKGWEREELHITADHVDIEALLAEHERREKEAARRAALLQLGRKDAKDAKGKGKKEGAQKRAGGEGPALGSSPRSLGRSIYHTY